MMQAGHLRSVDARALRAQLMVLGALALAYAGLALFWVPPHNRLLLPIGLLAMGGAAAAARRLGPSRAAGMEPVFVWFVLVMLILIPVANPPSPRGRGFVAAALGVFCALGMWAVFRYPAGERPRVRRSVVRDLRWGLASGAWMAALVSLYVGAMFAVAAVLGQDLSGFGVSGFGLVVGAYWVGGLLAGAVAGLGRPMGRWPLGRMLVGVPATAAVYGAAGMAIRLMDGAAAEAVSPVDTAVLLVFSLCAGPAAGLMMGAVAKE